MTQPNLLLNSSFEELWYHPVLGGVLSGWHYMRYPLEGETGVGEFGIPADWDFKWAGVGVKNPYWDGKDYNLFVAPEIIHLTRKDLPEHEWDDFILDGDWTLKAYKRGAWCAGFSQTIYLAEGTYRFTVRLFADLVSSYKNGKAWATDPVSGNIRFTLLDDVHPWMQLPAGISHEKSFVFNAQGSMVIGFDLLCPFALANSGFFIDNLTLERLEEPVPTPEPERGAPRVQYARTYNVIPETATKAQAMAIFEEGWDRSRETAGGSYDDAGVGNLLDKTANLYGVPSNRRSESVGFFEEHYPSTKISFLPIPGKDPASDWQRFLLWQQDPRWRDKNFGSAGYRPLIHSEGCYITNLAMAMRIFGPYDNATPVSVDAALGTEGYTPGTAEALWSAIKTELGINIRTGTTADVLQALDRGDLVMAEVLPSDLQHFVLVVEWDGLDYVMLDPYKNVIGPLHFWYDGVESWRILSPIEEPVPPPPPPKPLNELLTLHLQTPVPGWLDYVKAVKPGWVKLVGGFEAARDVKAVSPGTKVLIRQHLNDVDTGICLDDPDKWRAASLFLDRFWGSLAANAPWIDAVEGLNETIPTGNATRIQQAVDFAVAFADELAARCEDANIVGIVPCLLNAAVGNPEHGPETALLVAAARAAVEHGGFLGYHPYFPAHINYAEQWLEEEGYHHHLRALGSWDMTFAAYGLKPRYLFTEMGAIGMTARSDGRPGSYDSEAGWRKALDGDLDRYIKLLIRFRDKVNVWNSMYDNRVESLMIFTTGIGVKWPHFLMNEDELKTLAAALRR